MVFISFRICMPIDVVLCHNSILHQPQGSERKRRSCCFSHSCIDLYCCSFDLILYPNVDFKKQNHFILCLYLYCHVLATFIIQVHVSLQITCVIHNTVILRLERKIFFFGCL